MNINRRAFLGAVVGLPAMAKASAGVQAVIRLDAAMDDVISPDARIEVLGSGYAWAEGPAWVKDGGYLLFSDPPNNIMHRWRPGGAPTPFLHPSGHTLPVPDGIREPGVNGITVAPDGSLLMADSGNRCISRLNLKTGKREVLVDGYQGKRFNSPNDLCVSADGSIWFTDPPYGLAQAEASPLKELDFNGLFRLSPDGALTLVDSSLHRPNGVAVSPDGKRLFVALSDEKRPIVLAYALGKNGLPSAPPGLFHDTSAQAAKGMPGLPDGVKLDAAGRVFATGPGGVHVLSPAGKLLGIIATGGPVSNCCFGEDEASLFLTSHKILARVSLRN